MGYRRPHHRRAHTRTNADGSKSYVRETDVKGHEYERESQRSYSSSDGNLSSGLDGLLILLAISGSILFVLGSLLGWDDTFWYAGLAAVSIVFSLLRQK